MDRILPIDQNLIPVSFKRRLAYSGSFLEEYVEKKKLLMFYEFLKKEQSSVQGKHGKMFFYCSNHFVLGPAIRHECC